VIWHAESTHVDPAGHVVPAVPTPSVAHPAVAPQYCPLVVGSMHEPPQLTSVPRHDVVQEPSEQTCPDGHASPAVPLSPVPHCPVAPQKMSLDVGSMQVPPQLISVPGQETWQLPLLHTCPEMQTCPALPAPAVPHPDVAPQKELLDAGSTQLPPQLISVPGQETWQVPVLHTCPSRQAIPAVPASAAPHPSVAPQLDRSV